MHTLLSEHWHAVRHLRPRLREGVEVLHRRLRGKPWVLLFDPVSQRFHRAPPVVHRILRLMDGRRTLEELVLDHPRFHTQAAVFLERFAGRRERVLAKGEAMRLAESGNHCQGTLFRDGGDLARQAFEQVEAVHRVDAGKRPHGLPGLVRLEVADEMPRYL